METNPNKTNRDTSKEKKKFTAAIVDTTGLMKSQAIDIGNEKMEIAPESEELSKLKGWKNLGKKLGKKEFWSRTGEKIWKYGLKRDYNRNKEIYKASEEILKNENVFIGEGKGKDAHDKVMSDIIDQFTSGYDEAIHEEAGEKKVTLGKDKIEEEATGDKAAAKQLIIDWATGKIDKASFKSQEDRLFHKLKGNHDEEEVKGNVMYASNLFEIAEQVKLAIHNKEFLDNEDFEFEMIYGKSKASVRTEEHFNKTERIMDKILHTKVGQFANETNIAIALSCISSLVMRSATSLPGKIVPIIGTALISSGFAKKRAEMEEIKKRTADARTKAKGGKEKFNPDTMPVRAEMDTFSYKTESAENILKGIDANLKILETNPNLTEQELQSLSAELASLEALIQLSDRRRIDLITYSESTNVVKERLAVDCKKRQIKDALEEAFTNGGHKIPNGQDFETYIKSLATTEENRMISEEGTGIDAKDRAFNEMKKEKGWKAAKTAFITGAILGATMSEAMGLIQGHTGVVGDIINTVKDGHTLPPGVPVEHLTMAAYIKHLIQGDAPKMDPGKIHEILIGENHIKLPEGVEMIQNPDGSFNLVGGGKIFAEHLTTNPDGGLTDEAKNILAHSGIGTENHLIDQTTQESVSVEDHIKNNPSGMKDILKRLHLNNDTPDKMDLNELKTQFGGVHGTGIDADGNYELNVGHMTPDGSFHGDLSANAQELMKAGQLKMLFSMSDGTQNHVFEFNVDPDGKIIIPPGSDAGKLLFSNVNGHADFHGRFGEVAQDMGSGSYRILSTIEGGGLKDIVDTVNTHTQETILNIPGSYDGDLLFIPIVPGNPLEKLSKKQQKNGNLDAVKTETRNDVINPSIEIGVVPEVDTEVISSTEISKEEYDGIKEDLKMLNLKERSSEGIVTLDESSFKSNYGEKRYNELKHIGVGIPVVWNKDELRKIGDEMNDFLSKSKIETKENTISEYEKAKKEEADIFEEFKKFTEEHPTEKIPEEMEERYRKAEENLKFFQEKTKIGTSEQKEENQIEKTRKEIEKSFDHIEESKVGFNQYGEIIRNNNEPITTPSENTLAKEALFTFKDLSKMGTEFESKEYSFKTISSSRPFLSREKITVQGTNKKTGEVNLFIYKKKDLEKELNKKGIKITKTLEIS